MPVRAGTSSEYDVGMNNVRGPSARAKRPSSDDETDSLVLARKPAKRRRKANGLDHKLGRMLHRANMSYAALNAIASHGKRERTTSNGSSSSASYEVPRTPVDNVHEAVVSRQGRIGQGFKLIKLTGSSEQNERAFEEVFSDGSLPSWSKSRKAQSNQQNEINEGNPNPLPSWLSSTFAKLSSGHPLRSLVEVEGADSPAHQVTMASHSPDAFYSNSTPEEDSIFAFRRPDTAQQPFATDIIQNHETPEVQPIFQSQPQPFSKPGPVYQADAYALDFSNPSTQHSTPIGPPKYHERRSNMKPPQTPLPFSTPGPAASFTVSPPASRTRHLRFNVPQFDQAVAIEHHSRLSRSPTMNTTVEAMAHAPIAAHQNSTFELVEEGQPLDYDEEMADPFADYEPLELYEAPPTLYPTRTNSTMTIASKDVPRNEGTKMAVQDNIDDEWLFSAEPLVYDHAYPESHEDYEALLEALDASEPGANENTHLTTYDLDQIPIPPMPAVTVTPTMKKSQIPSNAAHVSPRVSTSSSSLPAKVDNLSDPFIDKTTARKTPEKKGADSVQNQLEQNGTPSARQRPKFRPAIIDEETSRKILGEVPEPEPEYTKTPVREEVEEFIRVFGSDERLSQLTNDTIESWD